MKTKEECKEEIAKKYNLGSWKLLLLHQGISVYEKDKYCDEAMELYHQQFKYDYSLECKCNDSPGSTWCCNLCGLPLTNKNNKQQEEMPVDIKKDK